MVFPRQSQASVSTLRLTAVTCSISLVSTVCSVSVKILVDAPLLLPFMFLTYLFFFVVRCMWAVPDPSGVILSHQKWSSNSDTEQVVILTLCGKDMSQGLSLLHRVLTEGPEGG